MSSRAEGTHSLRNKPGCIRPASRSAASAVAHPAALSVIIRKSAPRVDRAIGAAINR